jgi:hypothetical protein
MTTTPTVEAAIEKFRKLNKGIPRECPIIDEMTANETAAFIDEHNQKVASFPRSSRSRHRAGIKKLKALLTKE